MNIVSVLLVAALLNFFFLPASAEAYDKPPRILSAYPLPDSHQTQTRQTLSRANLDERLRTVTELAKERCGISDRYTDFSGDQSVDGGKVRWHLHWWDESGTASVSCDDEGYPYQFSCHENRLWEYEPYFAPRVPNNAKSLRDAAQAFLKNALRENEDCRIEEFEEKPMVSNSNIVSTGIYVIRRRQLIELVERCAQEDRYDFVKDILIRYKNLKRIYGYKMQDYWSNIAAVDSYYRTNMDFLKPEVRNYFFHQYPDIYSKVDDLPPAKYNPGSEVRNSLVSAGCIINGTMENSILFKKVFVGENCVIKNSIILNDVYLGDNTHIENCIVESCDTIRANSYHVGEDDIKIVIEKNERYVL